MSFCLLDFLKKKKERKKERKKEKKTLKKIVFFLSQGVFRQH